MGLTVITVPADLPLTPQRIAHAAGELRHDQRAALMQTLIGCQAEGGQSRPRIVGELTRRFG